MRFALIGGDRRTAHLARLLLRDGHRLRSFALERAELPPEVSRESCLQSCVYGADCVLLPLPAERGGYLNAPFSAEEIAMGALVEALWPGQLLIGGGLGDETVTAALRAGLQAADLLQRPELTVGNAALTAEGAIGLMIRESERSLWGSPCLVLGWGRIGRILALRLRALGAEVSVAARSGADRALAEALGIWALDYGQIDAALADAAFVVNTVPARVLTEQQLCLIAPEALLLELASLPGGFDRELAVNIGLHIVEAPGLPGRTAPESAAELLRRAIEGIIEEMEERRDG